MGEGMQNSLQTYCERAFPAKQGMRVSDLTSISAGWESDIYSFDIEHGSAEERQREALVSSLRASRRMEPEKVTEAVS